MIQNVKVGHSMTVVSIRMLNQLIHIGTKSELTFQERQINIANPIIQREGKSSHIRG